MFHSKDSGCRLSKVIMENGATADHFHKLRKTRVCKTHGIVICHCGFEWGKHYEGENIKELVIEAIATIANNRGVAL